jgi:hypothetical protein
MATAEIRAAAVAAITAEADLVVALAAPVQAAVVAMATAAENADRIGMVPRLSHHVPHDATGIMRMGNKPRRNE